MEKTKQKKLYAQFAQAAQKNSLLNLRLYTGISGVAMPFFYFLYSIQDKDFQPYPEVIALTATLMAGGFILSWVNPWVKKHAQPLLFFYFYYGTVYILFVVWRNDFQPNHVVNLYLVLFAATIIFTRRSELVAFYTTALVGTALVSSLAGFPPITSLVVAGVVVVGIVGYITLFTKFKTYQSLVQSNEQLQSAVTERQHAEELNQTILDSSIEGFVLIDLDGNYVDANQAYAEMTGYTREELLTMGISDLQAEMTPEEIKKKVARIVRDKKARFDTKHRRKDGTIFDVAVSVNYIDQHGGLLVEFIRDISVAKKREAELQRRNDEFMRMNRAMIDRELRMRELKGRLTKYESKKRPSPKKPVSAPQ